MYKDINGIYCNTTLTNEVFSRYLSVSNHLYVLIRTFALKNTYIEANLHEVNIDNMTIIELPNMNSIKGIIFKRKGVINLIDQYLDKATYVFARMPSVISNIVISRCRKRGKEYLVEVGGCAWDSYWNHGLKGKLIAPFMFVKTKKNIENAFCATYVTESFLQKRYPNYKKTTHCSNVFIDKEDESVLLNRHIKIDCYSENSILKLGTISAIDVAYKGQKYVIKALGMLKKRGISFDYDLIGVGDKKYLFKYVKKYGLENNVNFLGILTHFNVMTWLENIDIYIQPSKQEGLPRALIEAMSKAVPAFGSNVAGIPELLNPKCIFKKGQAKGIANKLLSIDKDELKICAEENFIKAYKYEHHLIEKRRSEVFDYYVNEICKTH